MVTPEKNEILKRHYVSKRVEQLSHHFQLFFAKNESYDNLEAQEAKAVSSYYTLIEHEAFSKTCEIFNNEGFFAQIVMYEDSAVLVPLEEAKVGITRMTLIISYDEISDAAFCSLFKEDTTKEKSVEIVKKKQAEEWRFKKFKEALISEFNFSVEGARVTTSMEKLYFKKVMEKSSLTEQVFTELKKEFEESGYRVSDIDSPEYPNSYLLEVHLV